MLEAVYLCAGKWLVVNRNTENPLTASKNINSGSLKNVMYRCVYKSYVFNIHV